MSNVSLSDPPLSLAGLGVPSKEALAGDATPQTYLLLGAEFTVSGRILGWEMNIETLGSGALTMAVGKVAMATGDTITSSNEINIIIISYIYIYTHTTPRNSLTIISL